MAEDRRRSAEIRRMASQKVAAEMVKGATYDSQEEARTAFLDLVDWIDDDVVAAGDRAEKLNQSYRSETPPVVGNPATDTQPSPNGSEAVSDGASDPLSESQTVKMAELLAEVDPALLKLQLHTMNLPFQDDGSLSLYDAILGAVDLMTKGQARLMMEWMRNVKS